jgi:hypothetical protein
VTLKDNVRVLGITLKYLLLTGGLMKLSEWVSKFDLPFMFDFESRVIDKTIKWSYTDECQEKQFWETWLPKKSDIKIRSKLPKGKLHEVKNELWEDLQEDLQILKDRLNEKRRQKRLDKKV